MMSRNEELNSLRLDLSVKSAIVHVEDGPPEKIMELPDSDFFGRNKMHIRNCISEQMSVSQPPTLRPEDQQPRDNTIEF